MRNGVLDIDFVGRPGRLFGLSLQTALLTVATLGLYRFWMKTRLRRYLWSSIRPGGLPLEYVGLPTEKLLGFLTAVVMMAFYIGIVNLILMFASYALFQGNFWGYGVSFLGVLPIIFFAQYRARRYVLARTRWRGIRFGVDPAGWGYALRALGWWLATVLTLGILWPVKTFKLEKYRTDRTFYGTARMSQEGGAWLLARPFLHLYIAGALLVGGVTGVMAEGSDAVASAGVLALALGIPWFGWGLAAWRARSYQRLTGGKRLGEIRLHAEPRAGRILGIWIVGYLLTGLCLVAAAIPFLVILALLSPALDVWLGTAQPPPGELPPVVSSWVLLAAGIGSYFLFFVLWNVLRQVFVVLPILRHLAETTAILLPASLALVKQREFDAFAEAEGFADALDVGAAL